MRIAIVCGAGIVSGKEIMALELGQGLREGGMDVFYLTSRWGSGEFARRTEDLRFSTTRLWLGFISATLTWRCMRMTVDQLRRWPALLLGYGRFLRDVSPDRVIHTNWQHALLLLPFLQRERDLFWLHEGIGESQKQATVFRFLSRRLRNVAVVSDATASSLRQVVQLGRIRVIRNGIKDPASESPVIKHNGQTIGIVGQIGQWKGHDDLLLAFALLVETHPQARLEIFGKGSPEYEAELQRRINDLGLYSYVKWNGFVRDPNEIYSALAVLVVPSRSNDPLPTSAIEAAFFRVPVVASRRGGLPEIVEEGRTGLLFEAGAVAELTERMSRLLSDAKLRCELGTNARARAQAMFSRERFVQEFAQLLSLPAVSDR